MNKMDIGYPLGTMNVNVLAKNDLIDDYFQDLPPLWSSYFTRSLYRGCFISGIAPVLPEIPPDVPQFQPDVRPLPLSLCWRSNLRWICEDYG